eukprot:m.57167 g.57167  ORF g.57167 m.57167 type:complete len:337 (-) comp12707_c1_seq1:289-1299(-)
MGATQARHLVSKKKRRFRKDGFDLDLVYVTDRIVAMGFPSTGTEAFYRNPLSAVQKFLRGRHEEHFRIYNLCVEPERQYPETLFPSVAKYPFADHNAPPFELLEQFCLDADQWLAQDPDNIIVTHCKAGKGRTGVMICAYLVHTGANATAKEAFSFYGTQRAKDGKGVTIPSQKRYVGYYEQYLKIKDTTPYEKRESCLRLVTIKNPPRGTFRVRLFQGAPVGKETHLSFWFGESASSPDTRVIKNEATGQVSEYVLELDAQIAGDVRLVLEKQKGDKKGKAVCQLWFNTFFEHDAVTLSQIEVDKAHKDKKNKFFPEGFAVQLVFRPDVPAATAE